MSAITTVPDLLRAQAARIPDQPFVRWRGRSVSYGEFDARTDALAAGLADLDVKPGDVVSVMLPNCLEFLEAWWAILKAGAVFGPINPAFTAPEAAYVVGHSQAVAIVTDGNGTATLGGERGAPELAQLRHVISVDEGGDLKLGSLAGSGGKVPASGRGPDDLATLMYTSGTTGKPKGAMLTHGNVLANAAMGAELLPLVAGERVGMMLPLFHVNAQIVTCVVPMMVGCEVAMWERFSASKFWQTVAELEPVAISAVPDDPGRGAAHRRCPDRAHVASLHHLRRRAAVTGAARGVRGALRHSHSRGLRSHRVDVRLVDQPVLRGA